MRLFKIVLCATLSVGLWACGGGGGSPGSNPNQSDLTTSAPDGLILPAGSAQTYQITGGVPPYSVASPNPSVLAAEVVGGSKLVLTGLNATNTPVAVLVRDSKGTSVTTNVTVSGAGGVSAPLFSTAEGGVTLRVGSSADYVVGGGTTPYVTPTSGNPSVAIATLSGGTLRIIAVSTGTANITLRDAAGATLTIAVTVQNPPFAVNPTAGAGSVGDVLTFGLTGGVPFTVGGGAQTYALINNSPSLASASLTGSSLTVRLLATGTASIVVSDSEGTAVNLSITVSNTVPNFRVAPSALTISENYDQAIPLLITGGTAPYTVFSSNSLIVPATVTGSTISLGGGSAGGKRCVAANSPITITAVDSLGLTSTHTLTITDTGVACP